MLNVQWQKCKFVNHNEQPICGVCLDRKCQSSIKLCCINCVVQQHNQHEILDLKKFEEWFQNSLQYEAQITNLVDKWQNEIIYLFTQLRKSLQLKNHIDNFENFSQLGLDEFNRQIKSLINIKTTYDRLNNEQLNNIFNSVLKTLGTVVSLLQTTNMRATTFIQRINCLGSKSKTLQPQTLPPTNLVLSRQMSSPQTEEEQIQNNVNYLTSSIFENAKIKQNEQNWKENYLSYGIDLVLKGKYLQAHELFKKQTKENLNDFGYWAVVSLQNIGQYNESIEICRDILKENKLLYKVQLLLCISDIKQGIGLIQVKRYNEALEAIIKYLAIKPTCFNGLTQAGIILFELEQYDSASKYFNLALSQYPDIVDALFYQGQLFIYFIVQLRKQNTNSQQIQNLVKSAKEKFQKVQQIDQNNCYQKKIMNFYEKYIRQEFNQ